VVSAPTTSTCSGIYLEALDCGRDRTRPIELILTLETPRGILQALQIAEASARTTAIPARSTP